MSTTDIKTTLPASVAGYLLYNCAGELHVLPILATRLEDVTSYLATGDYYAVNLDTNIVYTSPDCGGMDVEVLE